jgi:hypothetical protein
MDSKRLTRGFNRIFIVSAVVWAFYCLLVYPLQTLHDSSLNGGKMGKVWRIFALFALGVLPVWGQAQKAAQLADLNVYGDFLNADGVWRADNLNDKTELSFDAATRVECYKHGGKVLINSDAYCMQATASIVLGMPDIQVDYLPVVVWDQEKVIAASSSTAAFPICTWTQITINLHDHSVMATDTRKLGKGHEGLNNSCELVPLAQTYHLVEKMQELQRRRLRAAQNKESE